MFVGEVTIAGAIKGTPYYTPDMGIEASVVADAFWTLFQGRSQVRARVTPPG